MLNTNNNKKNKISYHLVQMNLTEKIDSENNREVIYCPQDFEYWLYCEVCDKLYIERFYKKYLQTSTHFTKIREIYQTNKTITNI